MPPTAVCKLGFTLLQDLGCPCPFPLGLCSFFIPACILTSPASLWGSMLTTQQGPMLFVALTQKWLRRWLLPGKCGVRTFDNARPSLDLRNIARQFITREKPASNHACNLISRYTHQESPPCQGPGWPTLALEFRYLGHLEKEKLFLRVYPRVGPAVVPLTLSCPHLISQAPPSIEKTTSSVNIIYINTCTCIYTYMY